MFKKENQKADNKPKVNVRELSDKYQENCDRMLEIADLCQTENRERTDAENTEYEAMVRENGIIEMRLRGAAADQLRENPDTEQEMVRILRENVKAGRKTEVVFVRDVMMVGDVSKGRSFPSTYRPS